jgi:TonB family protein
MMNLLIYFAQVLLVVLAATAAIRVLRPAVPRLRLAYWRAVVLLCLLLPVIPGGRGDGAKKAANVPTFEVVTDTRAAGAAMSSFPLVVAWLPWIFAAGAAARGSWLMLGLIRLQRLRRRTEPALLADAVADLHRSLAPHAQLRWHDGLTQPVTFGFRQPIVLLPLRMQGLSPDVQRAVVCHELVHVVRHDWLWTVLEEAVRSAFWFHPAMRWALTQTQLSREQTVDARAIAMTGARRTYLQALMEFTDIGVLSPAAPFVRRRQLALRIKEISQEVRVSPIRVALSGVVLAFVLVASGLAVTAAVPLQSNTVPSATVALRPASGAPPPPALHKVKPPYPADVLASAADLAATITVTATVSPDGSVTRVDEPKWRLTIGSDSNIGDEEAFWRSKPWLPFVREAEAAVRQWKFAKSATESTATVEFVFSTRKDVESPLPAPRADARRSARPAPGPTSARPGEPTTPAATTQGPRRVGGDIKPPRKIFDVKPVYPTDAAAASVQGVVILEVTIAKDGSVADATIRRSIPQLDQAALDAVRQWRFTPTVIDEEPVEVVMTVTVNFTLSSGSA